MKITAVTPVADASDPAHPDHDRWVKETTLKMEVEHAKRLGLSFRDAEAENLRLLELTERKADGKRPESAKRKPKNAGHAERKAARGVTVKAAKPIVRGMHLSPCGRCGTCLRCKRERRVAAMCVRANQGDMHFVNVLWRLWAYAEAARGGTGKFAGMNPADANRMVIRRLEEVCDATIPMMGQWR